MSTQHCNNRIVCPGSDSPFANLSAEDPDPFLFLGVNFCFTGANQYPGYPKVVFTPDGFDAAQIGAANLCPVLPIGFFSPVPVGPPPANPPINAICLSGCPPDVGPDSINFVNTAQTCTVCCPSDNPCVTFTMEEGKIQGRTQDEADFWAKRFACRTAVQMALAECPHATCLTIDGVLVCLPDNLIPDYTPPPAIAVYWNSPRSCTLNCPDGTPNVYTVRAGLFAGRNQASADAAAASYACRLASTTRFCVTSLDAHVCAGASGSFVIYALGGGGTITWTPTGGALPGGITANAVGRTLILTGTASTPGNFTFSYHVTDSTGHAVDKSFSVSVLGITNGFELPSTSQGADYNVALIADGGTAPYLFVLASGILPQGITLSSGGVLSGTVTESVAADYTFKVALRDDTGLVCFKDFSIFLSVGCILTDATQLPPFDQGQPYSYQFNVSGGIAPYTFTKTKGVLPLGLSLSSSGLISGTVSLTNGNIGTKFTVKVTDSSGPPVTCFENFQLPILDYNNYPPGKKWRIKNYTDLIFTLTPGCTTCGGPHNPAVAWDGAFDFQAAGGIFLSSLRNGAQEVTTDGGRGIQPSLNKAGNPVWPVGWFITIPCSNSFGDWIWLGNKVGSNTNGISLDSPAGDYDIQIGLVGEPTICATNLTITIEEY